MAFDWTGLGSEYRGLPEIFLPFPLLLCVGRFGKVGNFGKFGKFGKFAGIGSQVGGRLLVVRAEWRLGQFIGFRGEKLSTGTSRFEAGGNGLTAFHWCVE